MFKSALLLSFTALLSFSQVTLASTGCQANGNLLTTDFDGARVNQCAWDGDTVKISIRPENKPINDSPWYAFKLSAKQSKTVSVRIKYYGGKHRYSPKMSHDGITWQPLPFKVKKKQLVFKAPVTSKPVFIAAQEIISNAAYQTWQNEMVEKHGLTHIDLGKSVQGRPLSALISKSEKAHNNEYLVVIGRQHPPEITGALAYFPFSESLLENSLFRQRFNIVFAPNLNPDGVAMGNWRHNANGFDLNRDWKHFAQPETGAFKALLDQITQAGGKISYAVDFHSTHKDIFYTMPTDYGLNPSHLTENWLTRLQQKQPQFKVEQKPGTSLNKGVFKQWIADTYGVHAVTYEMGDHTDRSTINQVAKSAANALIEVLHETPKTAFSE